jgi:AraC-like DNA-binding protein
MTAAGRLEPSLRLLEPDARTARIHRADASLLLMVDGTIVLSSYRGRERLERGALTILPTFGAHALRAGPGGAAWLELPWRIDWSLGATVNVADVDRLLLLAAYDVTVALAEIERIVDCARLHQPMRLHWIDDLRTAMMSDPHLNISGWAKASRVSREGAARAFRAAYDVSPARFRLELHARNAWARIVSGIEPLSLIALETGFADQSHMTRSVGWLTGKSPSAWRRRR